MANNIVKWQEYLLHHNFGGTMWTEFLKSNRKKQTETFDEYRKRVSNEYAKSRKIESPLIGQFDDIIKRLDTIISKLNITVNVNVSGLQSGAEQPHPLVHKAIEEIGIPPPPPLHMQPVPSVPPPPPPPPATTRYSTTGGAIPLQF